MVKKTITYADYDGNTRTEDFYFNISKPEMLSFQFSYPGGLVATIHKLQSDQDGLGIMNMVADIIKLAYGVKSPDGRKFVKNQQIYEEFTSTAAYSQMFMDLILKPEELEEFIKGIIPAGLGQDLSSAADRITSSNVAVKN